MCWHRDLHTSYSQKEVIYRTHISAHLGYGLNSECGKSTATAITQPDHSAVYNVKCGRPQGGGFGQMRTPAERGRKTGHCFGCPLMDDPLHIPFST